MSKIQRRRAARRRRKRAPTLTPIDQRLSLSIDELADASGISVSGLYNHLRAGRLVTHMVGARRIVLIQDALNFLRGESTAAAATTRDQEGARAGEMV